MPQPRPTRRRQRVRPTRQQTRSQILDAARGVFSEHGYHAASIDDVADAAGYSFGAIYSNFKNKQELFLAVSEDAVARQVREYRDAVLHADSIEEQARSAAARWTSLLAEEPNYFPLFVEFWSLAARDDDARDRFIARYGELRAAISDLISTAARSRGLDLDGSTAELLARVVIALGNGLALESRLDPHGVPDALLGDILAVLFRSLDELARAQT